MTSEFVSQPLRPDGGFNPSEMAGGAPGLPAKFRWGKTELVVARVLDRDKDYGDCTHGSGERYVRRHTWRVLTTEGRVARISFQRNFGRSRPTARWWLHGFET